MEEPAAYQLLENTLHLSEPIAALLRENDFFTTRLVDAGEDQAVLGGWNGPDGQHFQATYQLNTRTGRQTFELKARHGAYRAELGELLVRGPEDVQFLLDGWVVLAEARAAVAALPLPELLK